MTTELDPDVRIPPGTRTTLHGIDVVAVDDDRASCNQCPFHRTALNKCEPTPCRGITWLTVLDYTTHRLTS